MAHFTRLFEANGPRMMALFHVSHPRYVALQAAGVSPPEPFRGTALLDTGADGTCVDPAVLDYLGLHPRGLARMLTPSTGDEYHRALEFDVGIIIPPAKPEDAALILSAQRVTQSTLLGSGIHALIGRDVLQHCIFHYEGAVGFFSLAW